MRIVAALLLFLSPAWGEAASEQPERFFAVQNCAICHSIDRHTPGKLAEAPPFRMLHTRYPFEHLSESLAEGISTGAAKRPPVMKAESI